MAKRFGQVAIKRERGDLKVIGLASTPRGKRFIAGTEEIGVPSIADPEFKTKMAEAMKKLYA